MRTFLGVSLNSVSLCEGECYTECLVLSSKVEAEQRPQGRLPASRQPLEQSLLFQLPEIL